jgi:hypothetical protein
MAARFQEAEFADDLSDVAVGGKRPTHAAGFTGCAVERIAGN